MPTLRLPDIIILVDCAFYYLPHSLHSPLRERERERERERVSEREREREMSQKTGRG